MGDCKSCRYALYNPLWTEWKCSLKQISILDPSDNSDCDFYQKKCQTKGKPSNKIPTLGEPGDKTITENGTYHASGDKMIGYRSVTVKVPDPIMQEQVVNISKNGTYTIVADSRYDGLIKVVLNIDVRSTIVGAAVVGYAIVGE